MTRYKSKSGLDNTECCTPAMSSGVKLGETKWRCLYTRLLMSI